jgi:hypothetical protein
MDGIDFDKALMANNMCEYSWAGSSRAILLPFSELFGCGQETQLHNSAVGYAQNLAGSEISLLQVNPVVI